MHVSRYFASLSVPLCALFGLWAGGGWSWLTVVYVFGVVPLLDVWVGRDDRNLDPEAEVRAKASWMYTALLFAYLPVQIALMFVLGWVWTTTEASYLVKAGWILSVALSSGGIGITVAHELVHRPQPAQQWVGKLILMTVLYMHFAIEHVRGHHALVATHEDPATARKGQSVYGFLMPSVWGQWVSAWHLEKRRLAKKHLSPWSLHNEMLIFMGVQAVWLAGLALMFGAAFLVPYLVVAVLSFLLLEVVNYIEHYGLEREMLPSGRYARVDAHHSWNSDHIVSRMLLFELTRHADHHAVASRPYQVLRSLEEGPQLPTGYPGMVLVALFPPLWFRVMDPRIERASHA